MVLTLRSKEESPHEQTRIIMNAPRDSSLPGNAFGIAQLLGMT
jgi:hypothetical protein